MTGRRIAGVALALSIAAAPAFGQSLGDLARQEEARRAAAPKAKKTYSNADLGPGGVPVAEAPADGDPCYMSKSEGKCVTGEEMLANSAAAAKVVQNAPTEAPIRAEAQKIRDELANLQREIDQLDAQAADAALPAAKRQLANDAMTLKLPGLQGLQRRWARLEKQVKDLKLPHAWIEPVPANALQQ